MFQPLDTQKGVIPKKSTLYSTYNKIQYYPATFVSKKLGHASALVPTMFGE